MEAHDWKSVDTELPAQGKTVPVIISIHGWRHATMGWLDSKSKWRSDCTFDILPGVTHWMPLPSFPEEER